MTRIPLDNDNDTRQVGSSACFICEIVSGDAAREMEQVLAEDDENIAFLTRSPALTGTVLVAPKHHHEHVVRDLCESAYLNLMSLVYRVAQAVETVVPTERMYLLSLGSQQQDPHIHWQIAPLPPGVPYSDQQHHILSPGNSAVPWTYERAVELADQIRAALARPQ
ncbi:HIT family protein [Nocardia sputi]|uniref:HIT family protein n=1 Tax=Nocardia sputi TaxID=2943705 RepID=UPI0020C1590E|nr:HIT family protein [Nocardia sputi]